jgi:hypothetical protein
MLRPGDDLLLVLRPGDDLLLVLRPGDDLLQVLVQTRAHNLLEEGGYRWKLSTESVKTVLSYYIIFSIEAIVRLFIQLLACLSQAPSLREYMNLLRVIAA